MASKIIVAHGAMSSGMDMFVSLGPILLTGILLVFFGLLLGVDAKRRNKSGKYINGWRDERPTASRLLFSGTYYELEKLAQFNWDDDNSYDPSKKTGKPAPANA